MEAAVEGEELLGFRLLILGVSFLSLEPDFCAVRCIIRGRAGKVVANAKS